MKFYINAILLTCLFMASCNKDEFTEGHSIQGIVMSKPTNTQDLVKSRLLTAKILSIAFDNRDFREYFKTNFGSKSDDGTYFEECLLIKHLDDKVLKDGTSLKDFLNSINDCEVSEILNENLIDFVLSVDEMITIKLPDIFLGFDWDIDKSRPVVIATYPEEFSNISFIGYHYCNDSEFYVTGDVPQVFHVYVKHSEDYVLINEANIDDFSEFLPQLGKCIELLPIIFEESALFQGKRIVNLKKSFLSWRTLCSYQGKYIDVSNCTATCQRDCNNPRNNNFVLDHIVITEPIFYLANTNLAFRESCTFYFQSQNILNQLIFDDFALPNIRYSELGRTYNAKGLTTKLNKVPKMSIIENDSPNKIPTEIKYLVTEQPSIDLYFNLTLLQYGDKYYRRKLIDSNFRNNFDAENAYLIGTDVLLACDVANTNSSSGSVNLNFRY